ncbi:SRPBCC family protein [Dokdonia sp.]|uniref:SRPBCC family protein n=1 Tax=Dokdonia sp. TaxID=2024995 RepID=UPI0032651B37
MKFGDTIIINQPYKKVASLFADTNNLKEWQDGFTKKELISGSEGENGAISKIYLTQGKRDMELVETIVDNQLPHSFEAHYHHIHMDNTLKTSFISINDTQTEYKTEGEYTRISWVLPKLMALLFPSMFRKQAYKWMENFKHFAERQE